jgi:hypothetical protein
MEDAAVGSCQKYGSLDKDGRIGLYYTMSLKPNSAGLFLDVQKDEISVRHISGDIIATWQLQTLADRFMQKMPALLFVSTFTEERADVEYFHYYRAQLMKGTSPELLADQFKAENILVDLRLHDKGTMARNHGTGFRTYEDKLPLLFNEIKDLYICIRLSETKNTILQGCHTQLFTRICINIRQRCYRKLALKFSMN